MEFQIPLQHYLLKDNSKDYLNDLANHNHYNQVIFYKYIIMAKFFSNLCAPAIFYLAISIIALLMVIFQNVGNSNMLSIGNYNSRVPNTGLIIIIKLLCILFWTWILNLICKAGYKWVSWLLVLLPFIMVFFMMWVVASSH